MGKKDEKMTVSLTLKDKTDIIKFCKDNGFNLSAKTVVIWKEFIEDDIQAQIDILRKKGYIT